MSNGDNDEVEKIQPDAEGKIKPDKDGKYPEVVPWSKYVGIKESLGKKLDTAKEQVTSLEEKLKTATNPEEFKKVSDELEETKKKLTDSDEELKNTKEKTLTEKRSILVKRNIPEEKVKDMSVEELNAALVVLEHSKPGADMGSGSGAGALEGSPMELARKAYTK